MVFVCQSGPLEYKALLLAASLRAAYGNSAEIIAAIPQPASAWGQPTAIVHRALVSLGVRELPVTSPFGTDYPIGNKIAALCALGPAPALLLDSDVLCCGAVAGDWDRLFPALAAKPADLMTYGGGDAAWELIYRSRGLNMPARHVVTTVSEDLTRPYFNSGVVYTKNAEALGHSWVAVCMQLGSDDRIQGKYPWLDQLALPVAIQHLGWSFKALGDRWNFPAHFKIIDSSDVPFFAHYHHPDIIVRDPALLDCAARVLRHYPVVKSALSGCPEWSDVAKDESSERGRRGWYLFTGLPCSGVEHLATRLEEDRHNAIVTNDVAPTDGRRARGQYADYVHALYLTLDASLRLRRPVGIPSAPHAQLAGALMANRTATRSEDDATNATTLATFATLTYLSRLPLLRRLAPLMSVVACVRHPIDTIAACRASGDVTGVEDVATFVSNGAITWNSPTERARIDQIMAHTEPIVRQAMLWRHFAIVVKENRDWAWLIRHEDTARMPIELGGPAVERLGAFRTPSSWTHLPPADSARGNELTPIERDIVSDICGAEAEWFGYCV
jgi:hypothetical protein